MKTKKFVISRFKFENFQPNHYLEHVIRRLLRHIQNRSERDFSLGTEVHMAQWLFRVLGDALVELLVLVLLDLVRLAHPDRLHVVHLLPVPSGLLDLLRLLLLLLLFDGSVFSGRWLFLDDFFDHFSLGLPQENVKVDELRVLVNEVLKGVWLQEIGGLLLQVQRDLGSSLQCVSTWILGDGEAGRVRFPDVLLIVVVLGGNDDTIGDKEGGVESDSELSDEVLLLIRRRRRVHEL